MADVQGAAAGAADAIDGDLGATASARAAYKAEESEKIDLMELTLGEHFRCEQYSFTLRGNRYEPRYVA